MSADSNLARVLEAGDFAVTAEIGPPKSADAGFIREKGEMLRGYADAFNVTDNQTAVVRLSSVASAKILYDLGLEPVMQVACRDRNRIGLQSDVLGGVALGVRNILCITGDHQRFGNHPGAKGVFDVDSIQLLHMLRDMHDKNVFLNGENIRSEMPRLFLGATANPYSDPYELAVKRLGKKIRAGADFVQTQSVFNIPVFKDWMQDIRKKGLDDQAYILAGVTPLKSIRMMEHMRDHVPGVDIPSDVADRLYDAGDPAEEGYRIAVETIKAMRDIPGVAGVHITAMFWENIIPRLVEETGLYPRS